MMASSGGLSCPDSDARMSYYQIGPIPALEWNGGNTMVGAGTAVMDGNIYDALIRSMMVMPTPVNLTITDFSVDVGSAFISVDIALEGDLPANATPKLRVALIEDNLLYDSEFYNHILRDVLPDVPLTINTAGQTQSATINFTMDPTWVAANFRATAFVQNDLDKEVMQSCNTLPTPDYSIRYYAGGARTVVGTAPYTFEVAGLFNAGQLADTYTVTLDTSGIPADGSAFFTYNGQELTSASIPLLPGERTLLTVTIDTGTGADGTAILNFHSDSGLIDDRSLEYKLIVAGADILLVDDDGGANFDSLYFLPALATTGKTTTVWDRSSTALSGEILRNFDLVVWNCGLAYPTVDASDQAAIAEYLDNGGNLFISGQDIGWELYDQGGANVVFYNNYLHATYVNDDTNDMTLDGVPGTFTEGLALNISGGDGANNQAYPSDIDPRGSFASAILTYSASQNGAIMADTGVHRVVYLAFGYEGINNATDRATLMQGIIGFLAGSASPAGEINLPDFMTLLGNTPNPFNPQTTISFSLIADARVKLEVYDLRGSLVRTLEDGLMPAGMNTVKWDGKDNAGRDAPSGAYYYRLTGPQEKLTDKMMLVR